MRVTDTADRAPRCCAVSGRTAGPFVDFEVECQAPNPNTPNFLYLNKSVVEEAGRRLGMVPADEVERLTDQLSALSKELEELRGDMEMYAEFEERFKGRSLTA
jgi:hypothetical protein